MAKEKSISIFDFLKNLTVNKTPWESYTDAERKAFSPFMIQRWLSMNMDTIELVNFLQRHTLTELSAREVYKLYLDVLPKGQLYFKYIKGSKSDKYTPELLALFSQYYQISKTEASEYVEMLFVENPSEIEEILAKYGKNDKEIKALLKVKK